MIVQCKDRGSPLDVNSVGEFSAVIQDVGASRGALVSVFGYTEAAKHYAGNLKIDVMRMVDAENTMWAEYFGLEPVTFRQVIQAQTLLVHHSLELTFHHQTTRMRHPASIPYDIHTGELRHADGTNAGTAL